MRALVVINVLNLVRAAGRLGPALRDLGPPLGPRPGQPHPGADRGDWGQQGEAGRQGDLPGVVSIDSEG